MMAWCLTRRWSGDYESSYRIHGLLRVVLMTHGAAGKGGSVASGGRGGNDGASMVSRDERGRGEERVDTASSGLDSRSMTLARSPAPSVARPATAHVGAGGGDLQSEYMSKQSGRSRSRMGTQVSITTTTITTTTIITTTAAAAVVILDAGFTGRSQSVV